MGENADLETAEAIRDHIKDVTLPELEATLAECKKTIAFIEEQIKIHQNYTPKQSVKRLGEGDG